MANVTLFDQTGKELAILNDAVVLNQMNQCVYDVIISPTPKPSSGTRC